MLSMYQMKSLDRIHRGLVHLLSSHFSETLIQPAEISISYSTPSLYEHIIKALFTHNSCLYAFDIAASQKPALFAALTPAASALLKANNVPFQPNIARTQFQPIADQILQLLEKAWEPFNTKIGSAIPITNSQTFKLAPQEEIVAFFGLNLTLPNHSEEELNPWGDSPHNQGLMLCYPISALEPILSALETAARPNKDRIKTVKPSNRHSLTSLFANHQRKPMTINAILEGEMGECYADDEQDPKVALLLLGQTAFLGGDHTHPIASDLIKHAPGWIVPESQHWIRAITQIYGTRFDTRKRFRLSPQRLDLDHLKSISQNIPEGFQVKPIDLDLAQRIGDEVSPVLTNTFPSAEEFIQHGIGYCALTNDQIVCGASSAYVCKRGIAIQINTHPDFRRKGLAALVASHLIVHCLEQGIEPYWEAANIASAKLAEKLGYVQVDVYDMLMPY